jgi:hypothetical protein
MLRLTFYLFSLISHWRVLCVILPCRSPRTYLGLAVGWFEKFYTRNFPNPNHQAVYSGPVLTGRVLEQNELDLSYFISYFVILARDWPMVVHGRCFVLFTLSTSPIPQRSDSRGIYSVNVIATTSFCQSKKNVPW